MPDIQKILHPTDFSENARCAFQSACALARDNHATLLVFHVMMPSVSPVLGQPLPDPSRSADSQESAVSLPWPQASDPRIKVEHRVAEGDAAEEILRLAASLHCDLIIMGTHGRTGLGRLLTGSVAEEVLRKATCPVLVVKTPPRGTPDVETETTAKPGEPIDVKPLGASLVRAHTRTLVRTAQVEVVRLIVPAGQEIPQHMSNGEVIMHCLEGQVTVSALGTTQALEAGKLMYLAAGEPHALKGVEAASLLLTILGPKH
jgi:nucleotide-binding universal stress UspA family protein/quercetin dioxygenase-like cupin family protein